VNPLRYGAASLRFEGDFSNRMGFKNVFWRYEVVGVPLTIAR
jgi:hypothetical protein